MDIPRASDDRALAELRLALGRHTPELPFRYLYDGDGPALQEARVQAGVGYVARAEPDLLASCAREVLDRARPRGFAEMASGEGNAVRVLLTEAGGSVMRCSLLDTHAEQLKKAARRLRQRHRGLVVRAVEGDLREDLARLGPGGGRVVLLVSGFFAHLHPGAIQGWFGRLAAATGPGDMLLLGLDTAPREEVTRAWSDPTAEALGRNAVASVNARWAAEFDGEDFEYATAWDEDLDLLVARMVARRPVRARVGAVDREVTLAPGEALRVAYVTRWPRERITQEAERAGFGLVRWWEGDGRYALAMLEPPVGARPLTGGPRGR